ncbi:E3 ubiquitin-protein ligase RNF25-like isoform X2 [Oscarella lobularis]|uniref:E3 ubiquitin-protein ligase RNF25-like isoform X2 n=1 Tax=Oscarella lobularis TaxID=121494 RepID=UPI0033133F0F
MAVARVPSSSVDDELEMLREIYINEFRRLNVEGDPILLEFDVRPRTADDASQQHVCLTVRLALSSQYPHEIPVIQIRRERGMAATQVKEHLLRLLDDMTSLSEERIGSQMIHDLISLANDRLTDNNRPFGDCPICLVSFRADDSFYKTRCYHYFHSSCLAKCLKQRESSDADDVPVCPVCREKIDVSFSQLEVDIDVNRDDPAEEEQTIELSAALRQWQIQMRRLYERQKAKGGIIDAEAERTPRVLDISSTPSTAAGGADEKEEKPALPHVHSLPKNGLADKWKQCDSRGDERRVKSVRPPPGFHRLLPGKRQDTAAKSGSRRPPSQEKLSKGKSRPPNAKQKLQN